MTNKKERGSFFFPFLFVFFFYYDRGRFIFVAIRFLAPSGRRCGGGRSSGNGHDMNDAAGPLRPALLVVVVDLIRSIKSVRRRSGGRSTTPIPPIARGTYLYKHNAGRGRNDVVARRPAPAERRKRRAVRRPAERVEWRASFNPTPAARSIMQSGPRFSFHSIRWPIRGAHSAFKAPFAIHFHIHFHIRFANHNASDALKHK